MAVLCSAPLSQEVLKEKGPVSLEAWNQGGLLGCIRWTAECGDLDLGWKGGAVSKPRYGLGDCCAGPQLISVGFMCEDLWKELGLINTVYLAICRREQELTNLHSWQLLQPGTSITEHRSVQNTTHNWCIGTYPVIWLLPFPCPYWFCFSWASSWAKGSRRSPSSHNREAELHGLEPGPPPAGKLGWFPFHEALTTWQRAPAAAHCWGISINFIWFVSSNASKGECRAYHCMIICLGWFFGGR